MGQRIVASYLIQYFKKDNKLYSGFMWEDLQVNFTVINL